MTPANIKALRQRLRITQQQLAVRVGVSLRTVKRWEAGESVPHSVFQGKLERM